MLIEFRVENFRSLRDEQVLTMESGLVGDTNDPRARTIPGSAEKLSCVSAIYGANASGKSNVLGALSFMADAVILSHRSQDPVGRIPRSAFAWGPKSTQPSLFEIVLLLNGIRYEYGFLASDNAFEEEWLFAWPNGKKQIWFERDGDTFKFGDNLKGRNEVISEVTRNNALFLSVAVQLKHMQLNPLYEWLSALQRINPLSPDIRDYWTERSLLEFLDPLQETPEARNGPLKKDMSIFRSLLGTADVGIVDFKFVEEDGVVDRRLSTGARLLLKHQSGFDDSWLPFKEESRGTRTLIRLAPSIIRVLENGTTILVDELESSLHPALALKLVALFNNPETNPNNAQLLFTTHDTNLLGNTVGEPALRRDQVWLTEKDAEGATVLYPLTDYKPRKAENLERGYLQGRYGAIPYLGNFTLNGGEPR